MIKEVSFEAYIIPFRVHNAAKQIALLNYGPGAYGPIGGRFDDSENAIDALKRELIEELGPNAAFMINSVKQIAEHYNFKIDESRWTKRGAKSEEHIFFVAQIPESTELKFCEDRPECRLAAYQRTNQPNNYPFPRPTKLFRTVCDYSNK